MNKNIHWLVVVEGSSDVGLYSQLLPRAITDVAVIKQAGVKSRVLNLEEWKYAKNSNTVKIGDLENCCVKPYFEGVILLIDSDVNTDIATIINAKTYKRCTGTSVFYEKVPPCFDVKTTPYGVYMHIDTIVGRNLVPVLGIAIPGNTQGCVETALLTAYGYPASADEHNLLHTIAENVGKHWCNDTTDYFALNRNGKTRTDKFFYHAFCAGIRASNGLKMKDITSLVIKEINLISAIVSGKV